MIITINIITCFYVNYIAAIISVYCIMSIDNDIINKTTIRLLKEDETWLVYNY